MGLTALADAMATLRTSRLLTGTVTSPNRYAGRGGRRPTVWVVHDMESGEYSGVAANVATWFARTSTRASAHFSVDDVAVWQSVDTEDTAWHAPGLQAESIGVEHAGRARQTRAEWLDPFGTAMLELSAKLFAVIGHGVYGIEPVFLPAAELIEIKAGRSARTGCTTHAEVSLAFRKSTHWDPGPEFPMDYYLERCAHYSVGPAAGPSGPVLSAPAPPPIVAERVLRLGHQGADVRDLQRRLNIYGLVAPLVVDGDFGRRTLAAVLAFQRWAGIEDDGIVGPVTRDRLAQGGDVNIGLLYLSRGAAGNPVRLLQQVLNGVAGAGLVVDGDFGPATDAAVRAFQRARGLASDGIVGPLTWAALLG